MAVIYKVTNKINGKCYIGHAVNFMKRKNEHIRKANNDDTNKQYFHNALRKYGLENFEWSILKEDASLEDEKRFIEEYQSFHLHGMGYNLTLGGEGKLGFRPTESTKEKLRIAHTGKTPTESQLKALHENALKMIGTKRPDDVKERISAAHKGRKFSEEHKRNISLNHASKKEIGKFYQSQEYKQKMSESLRGKTRTPEQRERYKLAAQRRVQLKKQELIQGF